MNGVLKAKLSFRFSEFERFSDCDLTECKQITEIEHTGHDSTSVFTSEEEAPWASLVTYISQNIFHLKTGINRTASGEQKHFTENFTSDNEYTAETNVMQHIYICTSTK